MKNKVAIVDDSYIAREFTRVHASSREFTRVCLSEIGFRCVASYSDSRAALGDLSKGEAEVDVILIDFMMPEMDGLKFGRLVHQTTTHERTPILMISSNADDDLLRRDFEAGAWDSLTKPVSSSKLEVSLLRLFETYK